MDIVKKSLLGKKSVFPNNYDSTVLYQIPRSVSRSKIFPDDKPLPFDGEDIWYAWEVSWLNLKGKPVVAIGEFKFPANSPYLVESKSLKLYLNSLNNTKIGQFKDAKSLIQKDLSKIVSSEVLVELFELDQFPFTQQNIISFYNIDHLDVDFEKKSPLQPYTLQTSEHCIVEEYLTSDLLKSNCPVTHQPDWASIFIYYKGYKIDQESLLKFLVSFRKLNEFHEDCTEQIFKVILEKTNASQLYVECRYTRRGGLDINPRRFLPNTTFQSSIKKLVRQ